jgi:pimeloyl-ACP methyl ester carboxylesterase
MKLVCREKLSVFQRIWPVCLTTIFCSCLFGSLFYFSPSKILKGLAFVLLLITLWLGCVRILCEARYKFPKPIRMAIRWLNALSFDSVVGITAHGLLRPVMRLFMRPFQGGNQTGTPILLIHGYLWDWTCWVYFKWRFDREGLGPVYTINLKDVSASIYDYAEQVGKLAKKIEQETGKRELILIGHSMGGLVACSYAFQVAPKGKVKMVITIGSPLGGTLMARLGFIGKSAKEMLPDSDLVKQVHLSIEKRPEIPIYQAMSYTDELVIPAISAYVDARSDRHYAVGDIGHMTLLFSSRIADRIICWLKN